MNCLVTTFAVACAAALALTVAVRAVARRWGITDQPDGKRKLHKGPVALWGGIAVYAALVLGLLAARYGGLTASAELDELSNVLIVAAGIVCLCGAVDDCWSLNPRFKLALQVCAVLPLVAFGYSVDRIVAFGCPIELGWWGVPLTIAWLVGCINALNLLDGMDGLASLVGLLSAAMMGLIAASIGNDYVTVIALALAGSLAGFLVYNLPPATIFLGDSGSMVIGLVLGVLGMQGAMKASATLAITIPAVIMTLPMFDTVLALVRRKLTGRRFDAADREHIHHRLLDRGLSQWQALCLLGALCLATGAAASAATFLRNDALGWLVAVTLMVLMIRLRLFGHHELALVKQAAAGRLLALARRLGAAAPLAPPLEWMLPADLPFEQAWEILVQQAKTSKVARLGLILSREGVYLRRYGWGDPAVGNGQACRWSIAMTFSDREGEFCEISAGGMDALEAASSAHLSCALKTFARHFANRVEEVPGLVVVGAEPTAPLWDSRPSKQAA